MGPCLTAAAQPNMSRQRFLFCVAGAVDGFFMADTGLTCCEFAGLPGKGMTVVAGSESGVVHFLELPL